MSCYVMLCHVMSCYDEVWLKYHRLDKYLGLDSVKSSAFEIGFKLGPMEIISCICVILIERLKYVKFDKYKFRGMNRN